MLTTTKDVLAYFWQHIVSTFVSANDTISNAEIDTICNAAIYSGDEVQL